MQFSDKNRIGLNFQSCKKSPRILSCCDNNIWIDIVEYLFQMPTMVSLLSPEELIQENMKKGPRIPKIKKGFIRKLSDK